MGGAATALLRVSNAATQRAALQSAVLPAGALPLWVPLLTFYRPAGTDGRAGGGRAQVDLERTRAHAWQVAQSVPLWMVAGSTGDGWDLDDAQLEALFRLAATDLRTKDSRVLAALLRPTTTDVLDWIARLHRIVGTDPRGTVADNVERLRQLGWVGICVCPPVGSEISQEAIAAHYEAILDAARMPLAIYQLPQVTGCRIAPATFGRLSERHPEIILFKDSSGEDQVAPAIPPAGPLLVRGAESAYAASLRALGGAYDGLLLSTANVFGSELREIVAAALAAQPSRARALAERLERRVTALFAAAAGAPVGNTFANVNRTVAHLRSLGESWREVATPLLFDGSRLPGAFVERIAVTLTVAD